MSVLYIATQINTACAMGTKNDYKSNVYNIYERAVSYRIKMCTYDVNHVHGTCTQVWACMEVYVCVYVCMYVCVYAFQVRFRLEMRERSTSGASSMIDIFDVTGDLPGSESPFYLDGEFGVAEILLRYQLECLNNSLCAPTQPTSNATGKSSVE